MSTRKNKVGGDDAGEKPAVGAAETAAPATPPAAASDDGPMVAVDQAENAPVAVAELPTENADLPPGLAIENETVIEASAETIAAAFDQFDLRAIRVTATQDERRRAGFKFGREAVILAPAMVDGEKMLALASDPFLFVELTSDGETYHVVTAEMAEAFS